MTKSWKPILVGKSAERAWKYIERVDKESVLFEKNYEKKSGKKGWIANSMGMSLFCHYLYKVTKEERYQERATSILNLALSAVSERPSIDYVTSGFTGLGWMAEHFRREKNKLSKWPRGQDPNGEIDKYLISKVRENLRPDLPLGNYSLADEWVGYGAYALERWPHGQSAKIISNVVKLLNGKALRDKEGVKWIAVKEALPPWDIGEFKKFFSENYNLGVAHGVAGVIGFLANTLRVDSNRIARDLLKDSIRWLLAQDTGRPYVGALPVNPNGKKSVSRLAWCYGDLGISMVLFNAAASLDDAKLKKRSLAMAKRAAQMSNSKAGVIDPWICHGASGAFHIFNHFYQDTGDRVFLKSALKWSNKTLDMVENPKKNLGKDIAKYVERETELFTGKSGIALSLLAGVSNVQPRWDELF